MATKKKVKKAPARRPTKKASTALVPIGGTNVMELTRNALLDERVSVEKLDGLLRIQREIEADADRKEFNRHMSMLQSEISQIAADANNPQTGSKYLSYPALDAALRPYYTAHGFSVSFTQEDCPRGDDWLRMVCIVTWGACEKRFHADVQSDQLGPKGNKVMTATHASVSASSYAKRYALGYAFNVSASKDDDGNAAGFRGISASQVQELQDICAKHKLPTTAILLEWQIDRFEEIPRTAFNKTKTWLLARAERLESEATKQKETA